MGNDLKPDDVEAGLGELSAQEAEALRGNTRSQFLRRAGLIGGGAAAAGTIFGALAPSAFAFTTGDRPPAADFGPGDIGILNFALTLEYLESTFYNEAVANQHKHAFIPNKDSASRVFLKAVQEDENMHVAALMKVLGNHAIRKPKFNFRGDNNNYERFLTSSFAFENVGVHAYSGQAFNIKDPHVLAAALSIVTVEGRHASVVGLIRDNSDFGITPSGPFDTPQGATEVLKEVMSLNYITKLYPYQAPRTPSKSPSFTG